ncbi:glycosyltransferase family 2 protein [Spongiactinospora sp. TRM90649]|uniref:glycosyltransferase family 2 protein n=1 Tax=Spongiactinospora sp. TRM90649 TaxID=3031114 RepID=UPI0023F9E7C2|nr:glycosyltransferase family 2 protein [Spongiactinospora sp. TRM90649]MDF5751395.1 glycosyltransferase family 2 protein [Spongiactinospora sp. TRM90649]
MEPLLSVIVPFHNVEDYLAECLASLAAQSLNRIEVVMVDDGSTDGGEAVAKSYAAADPRFTLIRRDHQGPGIARNLGIGQATGKYLAFADADDVVPPNAYQMLVESLEGTGSDIACGGVLRIGPDGESPSVLHAKLFRRTRQRTHITKYPNLMRDRTVWNKVYRRSFWTASGLSFPPGLYEDAPVAIAAHVHASRVDLLPDTVYLWRIREQGQSSITQRRAEIANVEERIASLRGVQEFLDEQAPGLRPALDGMIATWDLGIVAAAVIAAEDKRDRARLLDLVAPFVDGLREEAVRELPAVRRLELHLLRRRMIAELAEVRQARQEGRVAEAPVVRRGRKTYRWYATYPYFGDRSRKLPPDVFDVTDEIAFRARVERVSYRDGRLWLAGHARVAPVERAQTDLRLWLVETGTRRKIPIEYTGGPGGRFTAEIDPGTLTGTLTGTVPDGVAPGEGPWRLHAEVTVPGGLRRRGRVRKSRLLVREDEDGESLLVERRRPTGPCRIRLVQPDVGDVAQEAGKDSARTVSGGG